MEMIAIIRVVSIPPLNNLPNGIALFLLASAMALIPAIMATLIIAIISILYFQLYSNIIEPDFVEHILEESGKQMAEKGLSEEQIDKALEMSKTFMSPGIMSVISFFSSLLMGALISVIGAAIFKNEK